MAHQHRLILILSIAWMCFCVGCSESSGPRFENVTIKDRTFRLEVAADESSISRGLGGRDSIAADGGMLFIFPEPSVRRFWMYECLVDIDIIFLDAGGRITAMHRMKAEPLRGEDESALDYQNRLTSYSSGTRAMFAIELKAGSLDQLNLKPFEKIDLNTDRLKALAR